MSLKLFFFILSIYLYQGNWNRSGLTGSTGTSPIFGPIKAKNCSPKKPKNKLVNRSETGKIGENRRFSRLDRVFPFSYSICVDTCLGRMKWSWKRRNQHRLKNQHKERRNAWKKGMSEWRCWRLLLFFLNYAMWKLQKIKKYHVNTPRHQIYPVRCWPLAVGGKL